MSHRIHIKAYAVPAGVLIAVGNDINEWRVVYMQATGQQDGSVQHELLATGSIRDYRAGAARALRQSLHRAVQSTAGWWLVGLCEGVTGIVIVTLVGATLPGQWGLLRVQPHPLWIVVLAIALRYGRGAGYAIGASSALVYAILEYLRPGARLAPLAAHDLIQPFLLLVGGVLIGEFAHAHHCRQAVAEERCERATAYASELDGRYQALRVAHTELERRIIGQPASVATVHAAAKMLRVLRPADLYPAVLDVVVRLLEAEAVALYLERGGRYELQAGHPADHPGRPLVVVAAENENATSDTVIARAVRSRTIVTIRDLILDAGLVGAIDKPALMAGPVLTAEGYVRAVVVVERLPFLRLAPDTIELFRVILDWVAMALDNAERYERASAGTIVKEATGLYSAAYTAALLERERARAVPWYGDLHRCRAR